MLQQKINAFSETQITCYAQNINITPTLHDKQYLLELYQLLKKSFKVFYALQPKTEARKMRKHFCRDFSTTNLIIPDLCVLTQEYTAILAELHHRPDLFKKKQLLLQLAFVNNGVFYSLNKALENIGVNSYEKSIALYLAKKYQYEHIILNQPIMKNEILVKEFDAIIYGKRPMLIEEKITLDKHNIKSIFGHASEKKHSHLEIITDTQIINQNNLPDFKTMHLIFSKLDRKMTESPKRKILRTLNNDVSLEMSASRFIDIFEEDINLYKAKQLLHKSSISKVIMTLLDQKKIDPSRWALMTTQ
jgi:hypothetical protein